MILNKNLTIVIILYDSSELIFDCLQKLNNFEIIIVDNGKNNFTFTDTVIWATSAAASSAYEWDFDIDRGSNNSSANPTTSVNGSPAAVTYNSKGDKKIQFIFKDNNGCKDTVYTKIEVLDNPTAKFTVQNDSQCLSANSFVFKESSFANNSTLSTRSWNFGPATTDYSASSNGNDQTVVFKSTGTKTVKLSVMDANGCKDSQVLDVTVLNNPQADFKINSVNQCLDLQSFNFDTLGVSKSVTKFVWYLDYDNNKLDTDTAAGIKGKKYNATGVKKIRLEAFDVNGCFSVKETNIRVLSNPTVSLSNLTSNSQCVNRDSFHIKASVTWVSKTSGTFSWILGTGVSKSGTSSMDLKEVSYSDSGRKRINITVKDSNSCEASATITVDVKPKPHSNIQIDSSYHCADFNRIRYASLGKNYRGLAKGIKLSWAFENASKSNNPLTDSIELVSYSNPGSYKSRLIVTDDTTNCSDTARGVVRILEMPKFNRITMNDSAQCYTDSLTKKHSFNFTPSITWAGAYKSYVWVFDSVSSGTSTASPKYSISTVPTGVTYSKSGIKQVYLIFQDNNGCKDTARTQVRVYDNPTAKFTIQNDSQCLSSNSFVFKESSFANNSTLSSRSWNFGPATTDYSASSNGNDQTVVFKSTGTKTVKLSVTDANGCKDSKVLDVTVLNNPQADFKINSANQCLDLQSFNFDTLGVSKSVTKFVWYLDYDNNKLDTDTAAGIKGKKYNATGVKKIRLEAFDVNGCFSVKETNIRVLSNPTVSLSNLTSNSQCVNRDSFHIKASVTWVSKTSGTFSWILGTGVSKSGTSSMDLKEVSYSDSGRKRINITVKDSNSCEASATITVDVKPKPHSNIQIDSSYHCADFNRIRYASLGKNYRGLAKGIKLSWAFENASKSNNPLTDSIELVSYSNPGSYKSRLIVTDDTTNCSDTARGVVRILEMPKFNRITMNDSAQCYTDSLTKKHSFNFTPSITWAGAYKSYVWVFDSVSSGTSTASPKYSISTVPTGVTYSKSGIKQVYLIFQDNNGCKDTARTQVRVYDNPIALIGVDTITQCANNQLYTFDALSPGLRTSRWRFDSTSYLSGALTAKKLKVKFYVGTGNISQQFNARLKISDNNKCFHDTQVKVTLNAIPNASLTIPKDEACFKGNSFKLESKNSSGVGSNSLSASGYSWIIDSALNILLTGSGSNTAGDKNIKYSTTGFKTIGLIVTDNNGCKDTSWSKIQVKSHPKITSIITAHSGLCVNKDSISLIPKITWVTKKLKFSWDKDFVSLTNRKENSTDSVLSKINYLSSGNKKAHLIVTDANGCTDTLEKQLFINPNPKASLIVDTSLQCRNNNAIRLVSTSLTAVGTLQKLGYSWSFDPSASGVTGASTDSVKLHYTSMGRKTFKFIAIDSNSCTDTLIGSFYIRELPLATVSVTNSTQCLVTNKFELKPSITWGGGSGKMEWFFNAPTTTANIYDTSIIKPIVNYRKIGIKPVQLRLDDANGCKDTIKLNLTVRPNPTARFDIASDTQCLQGNEFSFDASKSSPTSGDSAISTYTWNFNEAKINGDVVSGSSSIVNPDSVVYQSAGLKKISLIVINNFGCRDTFIQNAQVNPKPSAEWKLTLQKNCYRVHIFSFEGKGTPVSGSTIKSYNWDLGFGAIPSDSSGNSSTIPKIDSVFYTSIGSKTITLTVTDNDGCFDTFSSKVNVFGHPDA